MKSIVLPLIALVSFNASAEIETRTDRTTNKVVVAVGNCTVASKYDVLKEANVWEATLPSTVCQEYKTYQANVTGSFWNKTITPVAGTEKYTYKLENDTEVGSGHAEDALGYLAALQECNSKRKLLNQLREAQKGTAKCNL